MARCSPASCRCRSTKSRAAIRGAVCSATVDARNPLTNDTVKLFLPWMQVAREELSHGRAPLWNRYSFAGYPLLGNGESAPFSPLFLATLFVPLPKQIVAMAGLRFSSRCSSHSSS